MLMSATVVAKEWVFHLLLMLLVVLEFRNANRESIEAGSVL